VTDQNTVLGGVGRNASTLELFFDLVYVFAITQVVSLIHGDPTAAGLAKGAFMLALLWWTWSIYTWTTNWTGTTRTSTRLFLLAAMGGTLFMAMAVPDAFGEGSQWFGIAYFVVRVLAAVFYWVASRPFPEQRAAFSTFFPLSFAAALLILIGGFTSGPWLWALWIASALLDLFSALNAGRGTWAIDPKHFAERMGLFVIIALGESVVGIGITAAGAERDLVHTAAITVSFIIVTGLWWSYFDRAAPHVERHFLSLQGQAVGRFARDAYSMLHYPLIVGIVFVAVAAEDIVAHPDEALEPASRFALTVGIALVLLAIVATAFRAFRVLTVERATAATLIIVLGIVAGGLTSLALASLVATVLVGALVWEYFRSWRKIPSV
jgi:low temperature requirement protein LtrA